MCVILVPDHHQQGRARRARECLGESVSLPLTDNSVCKLTGQLYRAVRADKSQTKFAPRRKPPPPVVAPAPSAADGDGSAAPSTSSREPSAAASQQQQQARASSTTPAPASVPSPVQRTRALDNNDDAPPAIASTSSSSQGTVSQSVVRDEDRTEREEQQSWPGSSTLASTQPGSSLLFNSQLRDASPGATPASSFQPTPVSPSQRSDKAPMSFSPGALAPSSTRQPSLPPPPASPSGGSFSFSVSQKPPTPRSKRKSLSPPPAPAPAPASAPVPTQAQREASEVATDSSSDDFGEHVEPADARDSSVRERLTLEEREERGEQPKGRGARGASTATPAPANVPTTAAGPSVATAEAETEPETESVAEPEAPPAPASSKRPTRATTTTTRAKGKGKAVDTPESSEAELKKRAPAARTRMQQQPAKEKDASQSRATPATRRGAPTTSDGDAVAPNIMLTPANASDDDDGRDHTPDVAPVSSSRQEPSERGTASDRGEDSAHSGVAPNLSRAPSSSTTRPALRSRADSFSSSGVRRPTTRQSDAVRRFSPPARMSAIRGSLDVPMSSLRGEPEAEAEEEEAAAGRGGEEDAYGRQSFRFEGDSDIDDSNDEFTDAPDALPSATVRSTAGSRSALSTARALSPVQAGSEPQSPSSAITMFEAARSRQPSEAPASPGVDRYADLDGMGDGFATGDEGGEGNAWPTFDEDANMVETSAAADEADDEQPATRDGFRRPRRSMQAANRAPAAEISTDEELEAAMDADSSGDDSRQSDFAPPSKQEKRVLTFHDSNEGAGTSASGAVAPAAPAPKKRGRKSAAATTTTDGEAPAPKKKRTRAPKTPVDPDAPPKKRGRPRKHPLPDPDAPPKKRGRPRKHPLPEGEQPPPARSRKRQNALTAPAPSASAEPPAVRPSAPPEVPVPSTSAAPVASPSSAPPAASTLAAQRNNTEAPATSDDEEAERNQRTAGQKRARSSSADRDFRAGGEAQSGGETDEEPAKKTVKPPRQRRRKVPIKTIVEPTETTMNEIATMKDVFIGRESSKTPLFDKMRDEKAAKRREIRRKRKYRLARVAAGLPPESDEEERATRDAKSESARQSSVATSRDGSAAPSSRAGSAVPTATGASSPAQVTLPEVAEEDEEEEVSSSSEEEESDSDSDLPDDPREAVARIKARRQKQADRTARKEDRQRRREALKEKKEAAEAARAQAEAQAAASAAAAANAGSSDPEDDENAGSDEEENEDSDEDDDGLADTEYAPQLILVDGQLVPDTRSLVRDRPQPVSLSSY